ncbi:MAG: hypothetical protein HY554_16850 [Elusimicrobia bacterium]|nr:hypothetical protein [Elusimicrobiota bacterium]
MARHHGRSGAPRPSLIFLSGWTMPAWIWERQLARFAKERRVAALGGGPRGPRRPRRGALTPRVRAGDVRRLLDRRGLAPAVLVAWSQGIAEAAAYVERFGSAGLAGVVLTDYAPAAGRADLGPLRAWLRRLRADRAAVTERFVRSMFARRRSRPYLRRLVQASLRTPLDSAEALCLAAGRADPGRALARLDKPALIVAPRGAPTPRRAPGRRLVRIARAGHAVFVDQPRRFNAVLADFLKTLEPG